MDLHEILQQMVTAARSSQSQPKEQKDGELWCVLGWHKGLRRTAVLAVAETLKMVKAGVDIRLSEFLGAPTKTVREDWVLSDPVPMFGGNPQRFYDAVSLWLAENDCLGAELINQVNYVRTVLVKSLDPITQGDMRNVRIIGDDGKVVNTGGNS